MAKKHNYKLVEDTVGPHGSVPRLEVAFARSDEFIRQGVILVDNILNDKMAYIVGIGKADKMLGEVELKPLLSKDAKDGVKIFESASVLLDKKNKLFGYKGIEGESCCPANRMVISLGNKMGLVHDTNFKITQDYINKLFFPEKALGKGGYEAKKLKPKTLLMPTISNSTISRQPGKVDIALGLLSWVDEQEAMALWTFVPADILYKINSITGLSKFRRLINLEGYYESQAEVDPALNTIKIVLSRQIVSPVAMRL